MGRGLLWTSGVPRTQSRMWSQAELAAESALDNFLALMIAAPRCWTVVMNSPFNHSSFLTSSRTGFSPDEVCTLAWLTSGYCVDEWFPQMITFLTSDTGTLNLSEIWPKALLWSSLVRQVMFFSGMDGANSFRINALVFAGFATTRTWKLKKKEKNVLRKSLTN